VEVVLLDTVGELAGLYRPGVVAFGGGTLVAEVGGHSPAEADAAGCRLVRGPHVHANATWSAVNAEVAADTPDLQRVVRAALAAPPAPAGWVEPSAGPAAVSAMGRELASPAPKEEPLRPWLAPLALAWRVGVALRPAPRWAMPVPVVSVGALTAGGSGKSPVAAWFAHELRARSPLVVARGYGRAPGADVRREGGAERLGDELAMLALDGIAVASAPDRSRAIQAAVRAGWRGVAILDDALQDGRLRHDLEVVVLDARWPEGGGLLPVGTRRLPLGALARADLLWVNHGAFPAHLIRYIRAEAPCVTARMVPVGWRSSAGMSGLDTLQRVPVLAFAGIARPAALAATLRRLGFPEVELLAFPDHHAFASDDLRAIEQRASGRPLVCTEKDLVRLPASFPVRALAVRLEVDSPEVVRAVLEAKLGPA
jgi:tetraacyldisaccharide 4'-kinase